MTTIAQFPHTRESVDRTVARVADLREQTKALVVEAALSLAEEMRQTMERAQALSRMDDLPAGEREEMRQFAAEIEGRLQRLAVIRSRTK